MSKISNLFEKQAKLRGTIAQANIFQEGFTSTMYVDIKDADLGTSRTLNSTGPYLVTFDPKNNKKKGIEFSIWASASQSGDRVTFSNGLRGIDKDVFDDAGDYDNAKDWTIGTEVGITTDHINWNYLVKLLSGAKFFKNTMNFDADQKFLQDIYISYKPAYLTCGSSPTTSASTWGAVDDGEFAITIDGTPYDVTGIDFTNVGNNDQVAKKVQTAIRAETSSTEEVEWDGTQFIIRSADTSSSSAITVLSAVSGGTGTDISGVGATTYLDGETAVGTVTNAALGKIKFGGETVYVYNNGGDLTFKDDNTAAQTLADLAAGAGTDHKVLVSSNDTTAGYLNGKMTAGDGITLTEGSDGGDETLAVAADVDATYMQISTAKIDVSDNLHEAHTFFGATDITGAEAETLTDGSDAGGKHYHAVKVGEEDISVSGTGVTNIAHGLGRTPKMVTFQWTSDSLCADLGEFNEGTIYLAGATGANIGRYGSAAGQCNPTGADTATGMVYYDGTHKFSFTITVDATNIIFTVGTYTGAAGLCAIWRVE